ncbi:glycerophosphoryl diester phosphodiesterase membrane domain-containing protein [Labilibaculum euxinus]
MTDNFKFEKKRDFGELFNDTFLFIKYNFKNLLMGMIYFVIPFALLQGIALGVYQYEALSTLSSRPSSNPFAAMQGAMSSMLITYLFTMITYTFSMAFVFQYIKLYKASENNEVKLKQVWKSMLGVAPKIFLSMFVIGFLSGLGFIFLLIPGIYLMICFSLVIPIIIFQGDSLSEALSSCFSLIKNNWWQTFGFLLILGLIAGALQFIFQIPTTIYQGMAGFHMVQNGASSASQSLSILFSIIQAMGACFMQVIPFTGIGILYFSLVEQKQNPALLKELESVGANE